MATIDPKPPTPGSSKHPVVRQWQAVLLNEGIRAFNSVVVFGQPTLCALAHVLAALQSTTLL